MSSATVSRVITGSRPVAPESAAQVRAAIELLGYEPNRLARSLRTQRTQVWGLIISDIRNPFFTDVVRGVEDVASGSDHSLVLCNSDEDLDKERAYLELIARERMAGAIIVPADSTHSDLSMLPAQGIPVVTIDRHATGLEVDSVELDSENAAREAVAHLLEGNRRVACITGPESTSTGASRLAGYRRALADAGITEDPDLVHDGHFREAGGRAAAEALLRLGEPPDAIFCANNVMTLGCLRALAEHGVRIPDDIAVVGFDETEWARLVQPPLTTVAQPTYEMGEVAGELLLDRVRGGAGPPRHVTLEASLVVRESSRR